MNLTPIRDLIQKTRHLDPKKLRRDSFVYVDISSVDKDTKRITSPQTLSVDNAPSRARKEIKANDVLVATVRPNLNGVAIVPFHYDNQIASTGFCVLRADIEQLDPNFLFYFTQTDNFVSHLTELSTGAGYPAVSDEDILDTRIPLPPLPEQKRIAALLARADRLRQLRRTAHALGDQLLQSVFLEMFGDVVRNELGWERATISDLGKVQTGNTPSREEPENFGDFIEWIKSDNIRDDQFYVSQSREMLSEIGLKKGRSVEAGAVLVTCIAGSLDHIGDTAITNRTVAFNQQINAISPFGDVNSLFLRSMLQVSKPHVQFNASAGMKHIITKSKLEELVLVKPPLTLQEEFSAIVARVEGLRARMAEAGRQGEGLFEGLLAQSFGGGRG